MRKRDVVLMATVTSFEALSKPTRVELRQFAELFRPLYDHSSPDARRQAVAALSRVEMLPQAVCFFIGSQPINIAALFLSQSPAISDATLIDIARSQGQAHAHAIATRENLSPIVVDALAALHDGSSYKRRNDEADADAVAQDESGAGSEAIAAADVHAAGHPIDEAGEAATMAPQEKARLAREEALRNELRQMVAVHQPDASGAPAVPVLLRAADETQTALFVRFARSRQVPLFARVLTETLDSSPALAERILLDISGTQLAMTLVALGCRAADIRHVLTSIYPHLAQITDGRNRAWHLVRGLDPSECVSRVIAWRRADIYTRSGLYEDVEADIARQAAEAAGNSNMPASSAKLRKG
jgi:uncharacterized protein (DUF2336 family)